MRDVRREMVVRPVSLPNRGGTGRTASRSANIVAGRVMRPPGD